MNFLWVLYAIFMASAITSICRYGRCINMDIEPRIPSTLVSHVEQTPDTHRNEKREDMNSQTLKQIGVQSGAMDRVVQAVRPRRLTKIYSGGAIIGLFGGAAASLFGSMLTGASWFVTNDRIQQLLSVTGSVLLFLTIPLIVLGACCLDWMEKDEPGIGAKIARPEYETE
jgi:hypothetical protein